MARNNPNRARHHEWHAPDGKVYELEDLAYGSSLIVSPTKEDEKNACPTNPYQCVLAQWGRRVSGGAPAQIGRDKAIIPMMVKGRLKMFRCKVPTATREAIDEYDRTGVFPLGGFVFKGIPPSETLDSERSRKKRHRERWGSVPQNPGQRKVHLRNASRRAQVFVREVS